MADFYKDPNPTNDPNYLGSSREPDRQQSDTSLGKLFGDIGDMTNLAGKAVKGIFEDSIKRDARAEIEPIMKQHGTDLSGEEVKTIAGTGAKGKVRLMQMRNGVPSYDPAAVGEGSEALGFGPVDAARHAVINETLGIFDSVTKNDPDRPLPNSAQKEIQTLSRMDQAYRAGNLSDSYFYGQLNSVVAKLRARYQGWEDEIDAAVQGITGVQPANALRRSLLSDIQANQSAMLAGASADDKWRDQNAHYIYAATGRDPKTVDINTAKYEVAKFRGQQDILRGKQLEAEVGSPQAEAALSDTMQHIVRTSMTQFVGGVKGDTVDSEFQKKARQMTEAGGGSQKEIDELVNTLELRKQKAASDIRDQMYKPIPDDPQGRSMVSKLGKGGDTKFQEVLSVQLKPYDEMIALVKSKNFSALERMTNTLKEQDNIDVMNLRRAFPQSRVATAVSTAFPNNPTMVNRMMEVSDIIPNWAKAVKNGLDNAILGGSPNTPAPSPSQAVGSYGPLGTEKYAPDSPEGKQQREVYRQTVRQYDLIMSPENVNKPNAAHVATQFFKDRDFYNKLDANGRLKLFMTMVTPEKVAYIEKLGPEARDLHRSWAINAASDIWRRNSADLQTLLETKAYDIQYNPSGNYFYDNTKYATAGSYQQTQKTPRNVSDTITSVNNVIALMKPVTGNDPEKLITALGIDPKAEKQDLFFKRMWDKLHTKIKEWNTEAEREAIQSGTKKVSSN